MKSRKKLSNTSRSLSIRCNSSGLRLSIPVLRRSRLADNGRAILWASRGPDKRRSGSIPLVVFLQIQFSIVIRLLCNKNSLFGSKNSVVPPSNEFYAQPVETTLTLLPV
jgi:hypothetical protein